MSGTECMSKTLLKPLKQDDSNLSACSHTEEDYTPRHKNTHTHTLVLLYS